MFTKTTVSRRVAEFIERRKEPRFFADDEVLLVGPAGTQAARVTDRSRCGLGIQHTQPLTVGEHIQVVMPSETFGARVVWSSEEDGRHLSGLQIVDY